MEKYVGISGQIKPRRARMIPKREGYNMKFIKNFVLKAEDESEILENLLIKNKPQVFT